MDNLSAWSITADHPHFALLPGEVFAISKGKAAFAKIAFDHSNLLEITGENFYEPHLGDQLVIDARLMNEQIRPLKPISALN
jgi:hypothetical protein